MTFDLISIAYLISLNCFAWMDKFIVKRPHPKPLPKPLAKQGVITAIARDAQYKSEYYADNGLLCCRSCNSTVDHTRLDTVKKHLKSQVSGSIINISN